MEILREPAEVMVHHGPRVVWVAQPDRRDDRPVVHDQAASHDGPGRRHDQVVAYDCRRTETREARTLIPIDD